MMNDTFGPMYAQPLMRFDQDTQSWRTSLDTSLWDLPMLSLTLPASGLMRNGELFERPMLERPTSATDSSSLPTPRESMHKNQGGNDRGIGTSDDYNLETVAGRIATLPTPMTDSGRQSGECRDFGGDLLHGVTCENCKVVTLPTPTVMDMGNNKTLEEWKKWKDSIGSSQTGSLTAAVLATLPTPNARDYKDQSFSPRVLDGRSHGELPEIVGRNFLPTPAVNDMGAGKDPEQFEQWRLRQKSADGRTAVHGKSLYQEALKTVAVNFPTPTAGDGAKASTNSDTSIRRIEAGRQPFLTDVVQAKFLNSVVNWGKYEPAIRRWENLTREVPEPTVPHKDKRRLNPAFVEWMMGLPAGHVTGHGLSAAKELKMLGNGVVPQQARSAVTQLMERITQ